MASGPQIEGHAPGLGRWFGFVAAGAAAAAVGVGIMVAVVPPGPPYTREVAVAERLDFFEEMHVVLEQQTLAQPTAEERFRGMRSDAQQQLPQKFRELQWMRPADRAELRRNLQRLEAMPPSERHAVEESYDRFQQMTPEERQQVLQRWREFRKRQDRAR
jgi:hypothetical protein